MHKDEMLIDSLPQPYRFINKLLLQCIENSCDLVERSQSAAKEGFVMHNLHLAKVGCSSLIYMDRFMLTSDLNSSDIAIYAFLADTDLLVYGTHTGILEVYDFKERKVQYSFSLQQNSKAGTPKTITQIVTGKQGDNIYYIVFVSDETAYFMFLGDQFVLKLQYEVDLSDFNSRSLKLLNTSEHFVYFTDGSGRTAIYNCQLPPEITGSDASSGSGKAQSKICQHLSEPYFEVLRCPVSAGPIVGSLAPPKNDDLPVSKKKDKKKSNSEKRKQGRGKSPIDKVDTEEANGGLLNHSSTYVYDDNVLLIFGDCPVIQLYKVGDSENSLVCEFPLPSAVTSSMLLNGAGALIVGLQGGAFCFLNIKRKSLTDHKYVDGGAVTSIHLIDNERLIVGTENKIIYCYKLEEYKVQDELFMFYDNDILDVKMINSSIVTLNARPTDIMIQANLAKNVNFHKKTIELLPKLSFIDSNTGKYIGTAAAPSSLGVESIIWGSKSVLFVFTDQIEELVIEDNQQVDLKSQRQNSESRLKNKKRNAKSESDGQAASQIVRKIILFIDLVGVYNHLSEMNVQDEQFKKRKLLAANNKSNAKQ